MPNAVTDFGQQAYSSIIFALAAPPVQYYIALALSEPGTSTDGSLLAALEPTAPDYVRIPYSTGPDNWGLTSSGYGTNLNKIVMGAPLSDWGLVRYYALCTDPTGGDVYAYGEVDNPQDITSGIVLIIPPGSILIQTGTILPSIAS